MSDRHGERRHIPATEPAPTIRAGTKGSGPNLIVHAEFVAPPGHRDRAGGEPQFGEGTIRLTVEQALILQGFPADYPVQGGKTKQFEQIGNAIPPPLAKAILGELASPGSAL